MKCTPWTEEYNDFEDEDDDFADYDEAYEEAYGAYDADAEYDTPEFEEYLARFAD